MSAELVVFLGPSLPRGEASALVSGRILPPAGQGDVWKAMRSRPRAIALIDGVFDSQPSVWHHELLAAMDSGIAVFGGASMGALRAVELAEHGMVGVGTVFEWYRSGRIDDDAEVALLHADAEHDFLPLTVPLVNVRHAAQEARKARVLTHPEAEALVVAAERTFYQDRTWPRVLERVRPRWRPRATERWKAWASGGLPDLKRQDALACLRAAEAWVKAAPPAAVSSRGVSAHVRRRRLAQSPTGRVAGEDVLAALARAPDAEALADAGLRRALLAGWARALGVRAEEREVAAARTAWLKGGGSLEASGLAADEARRLFEELALERLVLANAERWISDGPSRLEALASEAKVTGRWAQVVRGLATR